MHLRCLRAFGNFEPDDEIDVPDGSGFDSFHFELVPAEKPEGPPALPAAATPEEGE